MTVKWVLQHGSLCSEMAEALVTTTKHQGPVAPEGGRHRAALICAFPKPIAAPVPSSGSSVGRAWLAGLGIIDDEVSGDHVRIERKGGLLRVADAGSRNGTWVNGARLSERDLTPMENGDVLRMGRSVFVFRDALEGDFAPSPALGGLVGPFGLRSVTRQLGALAQTCPRNVLLEGETGVGKELVARAIGSRLRRDKPFAAINMAAISRGVFESQIFGHVAGAFSDARNGSPGIVLANDHGVLFLDEIGELDRDLQTKLLRLLENREMLPVGGQRVVQVDITLIAATNRNLEQMVEEGSFRRDLYARLAMAKIYIPSLADRREDIFAIACELSKRMNTELMEDAIEVEAVERLILEPWPNNVRELDAALMSVRSLDPKPGVRLWALEEVLGKRRGNRTVLTEETVRGAIEDSGGNMSLAAETLGVTRGKLLRFWKRVAGNDG